MGKNAPKKKKCNPLNQSSEMSKGTITGCIAPSTANDQYLFILATDGS